MKKKIILSYDYELFFFDKSGTVMNTLIIPTNRLMDAMESKNLFGNFFIDVLMIKMLKKNHDNQSKSDLSLIEEQLRNIVKRGHRIELHLHPHWIDAKYNGDGTWDFSNFSHYSLASLNKKDILKMFEEGVCYLNSIGSEIENNYKVCAFRAGGWAVQPFVNLKYAFLKTGIKIDSSAASGMHNIHKDYQFDFRNIPNKCFYTFEDDVCKEEDGSFIEVPISSIHRNVFDMLTDKFVRLTSSSLNRITDGTHLRSYDNKEKRRKLNVSKFSCTSRNMFTFSFSYSFNLLCHFLFDNKNITCFIDHPKDFTKMTAKNIRTIGKYSNSLLYNDLLFYHEKEH